VDQVKKKGYIAWKIIKGYGELVSFAGHGGKRRNKS